MLKKFDGYYLNRTGDIMKNYNWDLLLQLL